MSAVVTALFLTGIGFVFGVLVGLKTKTKQASITVSAAHSLADTLAITETAAGERPHEYEDVILYSEPNEHLNTFTNNVAYGCSL